MGLESRLSHPPKEKTAIAVVATLVFAVPVAGLIARREISLRKAEGKQVQVSLTSEDGDTGEAGAIFVAGRSGFARAV